MASPATDPHQLIDTLAHLRRLRREVRRMFVVGTRYHYLDLYGHLIKNELADRSRLREAEVALAKEQTTAQVSKKVGITEDI